MSEYATVRPKRYDPMTGMYVDDHWASLDSEDYDPTEDPYPWYATMREVEDHLYVGDEDLGPCYEPEGNYAGPRTDGEYAHDVLVRLGGLCPWCGATE